MTLTLKDGTVSTFTPAEVKMVENAFPIMSKQAFVDFLKNSGLLKKYLDKTDKLPVVHGVAGTFPCDGSRSAALNHFDKNGKKLEKPVMYLCPEFFLGNSAKDDTRRKNTIMHELVHAIGATEIDAYIMEYLFGNRNDPFPSWPQVMNNPSKYTQKQRDAVRKFWCHLRYDGDNKTEVVEVGGNVYIVGELFTINVSTGDMNVNGVVKSQYNTNLASYLPPASWWLKQKPANGCV